MRLTMKSCRSSCLLQQTEEMPCYTKDCVGVDEDTTATKKTSEVVLGVGVVSVMSATTMQRKSPTRTTEYACGKSTLRESQWRLELVLGEGRVALRVTSEAARCRALSIQWYHSWHAEAGGFMSGIPPWFLLVFVQRAMVERIRLSDDDGLECRSGGAEDNGWYDDVRTSGVDDVVEEGTPMVFTIS